jgi:hypothetical protein
MQNTQHTTCYRFNISPCATVAAENVPSSLKQVNKGVFWTSIDQNLDDRKAYTTQHNRIIIISFIWTLMVLHCKVFRAT